MQTNDTIAAIATPPGRGGVGVIRISGRKAAWIAEQLLGDVPRARTAVLRSFKDAAGAELDNGLALYFPAPNSFTGEDVLELQGHGGPVVMDMLLQRVLSLGARMAQPGEFSQRAFLNDKLDLAQAEAIADLIDSSSTQAARAALRSLQGEFSTAVNTLVAAVTETRMHVEAAIDFPEEEIDFLADELLKQRIAAAMAHCKDIIDRAQQGALLRDGMTVVIAGRPNAGKSSLLNRLAGYDAAIVTDIPGTTRDVLRERISIDGMPLHIADTAGLRDDVDVVEAEGIRRAHDEMRKADRILYLIDASRQLKAAEIQDELSALPAQVAVTLIHNKIDQTRESPRLENGEIPQLYLSAVSGSGMELLCAHLKDSMGYQETAADTFSARRRHLDALHRAQHHLDEAQRQLIEQRAGELMAEELRQTQLALGEITGAFSSDDLLGRIFGEFCIGK